MRVLLVANPKSVLGFDRLIRLPNLGLSSLAANLDRNVCDVKVVDLIVAGGNPRNYFQRLLTEYQPNVVGLSSMVFQYFEALELAKITRTFNKNIKIVMGGYHPTVDYDVILESDDMEFIDFIIRNEGEIAFNELIRALKNGNDYSMVPNLSYRDNGSVVHNAGNGLLNLDEIELPDRDARIIKKGFHIFGYPADVIETTRGCTFDCNFCSILKMYGKSFRKFKIERVLDEIRDVQNRGGKAILLADDNVTLAGKHYKEVCEAIIDARLNKMKFFVQGSIKGIKHTPGLAKAMVKSGAKWVFLGIENGSDETLEFLDKNNQFKSSEAFDVVGELKQYGAIVLGGFIIGNPDDTEATIRANYEYAKKLGVDVPIFLILTPIPKTPAREALVRMGLVTNLHDYSRYTGFEPSVRTKHLSSDELFELREEMGSKYPIDSGSIWRLVREFPMFFTKLTFEQILKEPRDVVGYLKGILSRA